MILLRTGRRLHRALMGLLMVALLGLPLGQSAFALSDDQSLVVDVWRLVNESYVDPSFEGIPWRRLRQKFGQAM